MRYLVRLILTVVLVWAAGFAWFINTMPREKPSSFLPTGADNASRTGIVALTGGGGARIRAALTLLEKDQGARMLITGVHPQTNKATIAERLDGDFPKLACCVDLGISALTTTGNALEARDWVIDKNYNRVILVTSDFHIRRARAELAAQLPHVNILLWPVSSTVAAEGEWYKSGGSWQTLAKEYTKFVAVKSRLLMGMKA